jgi:putative peptidoglycan lipid II flippase
MWAPVLNNLTSIALIGWLLSTKGSLTLSTIADTDLILIGLGTTLSYSLQAFILYPVVLKSGIKLSFIFDWRNTYIVKSLKLAGWSFVYAAISQISYLVTVIISTSAAVNALKNGIDFGVGITPYANAYLVLLVPHSIVTVSVVTAMLPRLSNYVLDLQLTEFSNLISKCMRLVGIFTVPSAVIFFCFGPLIASSIFIGISPEDSNYLGLVLAAFSLGLIPISINLVLLRGFNAFGDIKSQVFVNLLMNVISILLSIVVSLVVKPEWVTFGLAIIFTFHYFIGIALSAYLIKKHQVILKTKSLIQFYIRIFVISILVILPFWFSLSILPGGNIIKLSIVVVGSALCFILAARMLKVTEVSDLIKVFIAKKE